MDGQGSFPSAASPSTEPPRPPTRPLGPPPADGPLISTAPPPLTMQQQQQQQPRPSGPQIILGPDGKEKQKEACVACRTTKVKCHPVSEASAPHDPCKRCVRLSIDCIYQQKKRGRKVGSGQKRKSSTSGTADAAGSGSGHKDSVGGASGSRDKKRRRDASSDHDDALDDAASPSLCSASSDEDGENESGRPSTGRSNHASGRRRSSHAGPRRSSVAVPNGAGQQAYNAPASTAYTHATQQSLSSLTPPMGPQRSTSTWEPVAESSSAAAAAASLPPQRDAWGNFLPSSSVGNVRYRDSSFYGTPELPDEAARATLTPSYAATSGDPTHYPFPQQQRPTYTVNHQLTPIVPIRGGGLSPQPPPQQAPPAPLYIAHIQPSWSDQRSVVNRGVARSGGGDQDPYGFPPTPRAQTMGPPPSMPPLQQQSQHPQHVPQQQQQQQQQQQNGLSPTVSTFRPSHSRNDGYPPPSAQPMSAVPSSSAATDSYNRPSPSASAASNGQLAGALPVASGSSSSDTPASNGNNVVFGLRHLLNHPSPTTSAAQGYPHSATARRRTSSNTADVGAPGLTIVGLKNCVPANDNSGIIPMSVKEVLTGHVGPSLSDDGEAGGEGEGWRAKKRRGIDGMLRASNDWDTPLEMRILSEEDVFELFEFFHTHLNIFVDVLDCALHTPLFVRRTSAILFTTILTIASRFRRPSLYTHLHKMVDNMLGRAFAEGIVEVGLIQSLSLLAFWKEADDRSTWRKVGYAIRLALEMDLHQPGPRPLPSDEQEARRILDRERTFIQLIAFDNTLFMQSNRPKMIPPEYARHVTRWARDHPQLFCLSDAMLAASVEYQNIFGIVGACRVSSDRLLKSQLFDSAQGMSRTWKEIWLEGPELHASCRVMLTFYSHLTDFEMCLLKQSLQASGVETDVDAMAAPTEAIAFAESVAAAVKALRYMVTDLKDYLPHSQDTVIFGSASTAGWLAKNISRMNYSSRQESLLAIQAAMHLYRSISQGEDAFSYQYQFLRSLLVVSSRQLAEQQPASVPPTPSSVSHLQPPVDVSRPNPTAPGAKGTIDELSPSALESSLVAPDASIEDILTMYADVFPFYESSNLEGTQTPSFSTAFVGTAFPSF